MKNIKNYQEFEYIEEGLGKNLLKYGAYAAAGIGLAAGVSSCELGGSGIGYNIFSYETEYVVGEGTPNLDLEISTDDGPKTYHVDSTLAVKSDRGGGGGFSVCRRITPTEARILRVGNAFEKEKQYNHGEEGDGTVLIDFDPNDVSIEREDSYGDNSDPYRTCRDLPQFEIGLGKLDYDGEDRFALLRQADEEVKNGEWID